MTVIKHDTVSMWAVSGIITWQRTNLYATMLHAAVHVCAYEYKRQNSQVGLILSPTDTDILNRLYMIDAAEYGV